ncbi:MAG: hypothetical protein RIR11_2827 [Bacteroidota bacterium]|jgi:hypothetical protein
MGNCWVSKIDLLRWEWSRPEIKDFWADGGLFLSSQQRYGRENSRTATQKDQFLAGWSPTATSLIEMYGRYA